MRHLKKIMNVAEASHHFGTADIMLCCKKTHQRLYFLRKLKLTGLDGDVLRSFYSYVVESVLEGDHLPHCVVW